jgi:SAM-dependent methyltransferase
MRELIKKMPIIGSLTQRIYRKLFNQPKPFRGSQDYWIERYKAGGNSGPGTYNRLAEFKAEIINEFVRDNKIMTVIDYGCGDGNQLRLAKYPSYIGFDVSAKALSICKQLFSTDRSKTFKLMNKYSGEKAQLTISLDVIYHLVEDDIFHEYIERLFDSSTNFVIIYASNFDDNNANRSPQSRHRNFSKWVDNNRPQWELIKYIPNRYPFKTDPYNESFSNFYIYQKS